MNSLGITLSQMHHTYIMINYRFYKARGSHSVSTRIFEYDFNQERQAIINAFDVDFEYVETHCERSIMAVS